MKFLHTMLRVKDLPTSISFYTNVFGLQEIRRNKFPEKMYTLVFLGYGKEEKDIVIEFTYNWDDRRYIIGDGFGHLAFGVEDLQKVCNLASHYKAVVIRPPGLLKTSRGKDVAFFLDPDGYAIEVIQQ